MRPAVTLTDAPSTTLLAVYLGDHLTGAVAALAVARRCQRSNRGNMVGRALGELIPEIEADRASLERLMTTLGIEPPRIKLAAATIGERLGRLKLNGQLLGYSPLSRLVELEGLSAGIAAKESLWRGLQHLDAETDDYHGLDLARLIDRAASQRERVEELRVAAIRTAFLPAVDEVGTPSAT